MGERELKGVAKPVVIHVVLPKVLSERWRLLQAEGGMQHAAEETPPGVEISVDEDSGEGSVGSFSCASSLVSLHVQHSYDLTEKTSHLRLGLTLRGATCATVRRVFPDSRVGEAEAGVTRLVAGVETAVLRTQGQVVCVVSSMCITGWNSGMR
eukprot:Hpha_TRINITY_DN16923_c4_g9::TRINITY_DN16923_c4_g9_i1::g.52309::m.52309